MATGRTGADAISFFLKHICRTLLRYQTKLNALIDSLEDAGTISASQATTARSFIALATSACAVFEIIASNSGF